MRILVVTECFWPDIYAVNDIVEKLVLRGHTVTVLTGLPDYTTSLIPPEYKHGQNRRQEYRGAQVYREPTIARRHGPIWRSLSYLSFAINGWLRAKTFAFEEFDVIYVWEVSPVTMAVPAIALKNRYHRPLFLYCMDIWPECVKAMNIREGTLPYKLIHAWTRRIYARCDHIAVSSTPFFEYLEKVNGINRDRMSYLPQFGDTTLLEADTDKLRPEVSGPDALSSDDIADSVRTSDETTVVELLFIGNIGKAQNLDTLIRAMAVFKTGRSDSRQTTEDGNRITDAPRVRLHMVGGGSDYDRIRQLTADLGLDDIITFYGPVPFQETLEFYKKADACVLTLDGTTHIGDTLPGKLQTYMAAGKPVFAAANGAAAQVIADADCGVCVPAGDYDALGQALFDFAGKLIHIRTSDGISADPDGRYVSVADYGINARKYFREHFMEEQHFAALEDLLERLKDHKL